MRKVGKGSDCHRPGPVISCLLAAACLITAAGTTASAQSVVGTNGKAEVHGTATYRERIALPPNAVFEATLEDHSKADAPADALGSARVDSPGQVPIRFGIPYDPSRIQERHSYSVRGRITVDGQPWFTTDRIHPVLTGGHPSKVELVLRSASASPSAGGEGGPAVLGDLPAGFEGDLPAADGPGVRFRLELFPDQAFVLRLTYPGRTDDARFDDIGNWMVSRDGGTLTLRGEREAPVMFAVQDARTLRKLDLAGREIDSKLNYDLMRREPFEPIEPRLPLRGMYRYMADAGLFQECLTGWRLPVAQEADNAKLEAAYSRVRREPGEALLVTLEGSLASRPRMEGPGTQRALVPERFINVWPGESCGPPHSEATLENTYWKLTRLGDKPAEIGAGGREVSMTLAGEGRRVHGYSGCNRFTGGYELDGKRLAFRQMAGTRMACMEGMELEAAFLKAIGSTASWEIRGEHLELYDAGGAMLLRFESRYMM
jgi:copper homeostasis protein (lipoprotein)